MDEEFLINIVIAGKEISAYDQTSGGRVGAAADQINSKILQYRQHFAVEVDTKDLLAMVAFQPRWLIWSWKNGMIQTFYPIRYRSYNLSWKDI